MERTLEADSGIITAAMSRYMEGYDQLVEQVKAGNRQACRRFVEQYQRLVAMIVFRMMTDAQDREELCQEVFLKVLENIGSFRHEAKITTWIGRIAYNTCLNHLRRKKIPLFADVVTGPGQTLENVGAEGPDLESLADQRRFQLRLQGEIDALPPVYRTIVSLFHLAELGYDEICQVTGLPLGTVKSYLFRARRQLRQTLLPPQEES